MLTEGFFAHFAFLDEPYYFSLTIAASLLSDLQVDNVAGHAERNEYHHVIHPCQGFSLGGAVGDGNVLKYW